VKAGILTSFILWCLTSFSTTGAISRRNFDISIHEPHWFSYVKTSVCQHNIIRVQFVQKPRVFCYVSFWGSASPPMRNEAYFKQASKQATYLYYLITEKFLWSLPVKRPCVPTRARTSRAR
jgi:hypothetical protein